MERGRTFFKEFLDVEVKETGYQKLHIFSKIFVPFSLSLSIIFIKDIYSSLILIALSLILCKIAGIPLKFLNKYIIVIISLTSFIAVSFMLFASIPGEVTYFEYTILRIEAERGVAEWKILVTDASLNYTIVFISRIFSMVLSAMLLLGGISDRELVWGLRSISLPYGLCLSIALFFKGLQLFLKDFFTVKDAMTIRGVDLDRMSLIEKFKIYVNALIPLLTLLIIRSYEISMALEARGISPETKVPTQYYKIKAKPIDALVVLLSILLILFFYLYPLIKGMIL